MLGNKLYFKLNKLNCAVTFLRSFSFHIARGLLKWQLLRVSMFLFVRNTTAMYLKQNIVTAKTKRTAGENTLVL